MALARGRRRASASRRTVDPLPDPASKREAVRAMFDRIAPRYDVLNRLFSLGLDQRWRRAALHRIAVSRADRVLDLACGTGDFITLAAACGATVVGVDFASGMLRRARHRGVPGSLVQADGARLPLRDASLSVVTCGFALRNFVSLDEILRELARVLEPGGRVALLDVDRPASPLIRSVHGIYFDRFVPFVGGLVSDRAAYAYLPKSTVYLPPPTELLELVAKAGFERVERDSLLFGAAQLLTGVRR